MSVAARLAILALKPMAQGACKEAGVAAGDAAIVPVADLLVQRFSEHQEALVAAVKTSIDRSWKALEIALNGAAWWRGMTSPEDRPLAEQLKPFLKYTESATAKHETIRRLAVTELRDARKKGLLNLGPAPAEGLGRMSALYAKFSDPAIMHKADRSAVVQMADELKKSGMENLAAVILPDEGDALLVGASRYFLERAIKDNTSLAQALAFADHEPLAADAAQGFTGLHNALNSHVRRLEELLGNISVAAPEVRIAALDLRAEQANFANTHAELYRSIGDLHRRLDLVHARVRSGDAGSARSEQERQLVRRTIAPFRELPAEQRHQMPALLNAVGQLEVAAGEFPAAIQDFQAVAQAVADPAARGEAHTNAFRTALEQPDYVTALKEFLEAVKTDGKRFATFPVGKFVPIRVIGSGGFGVAFLCKHKYLNANVVVKSLATDHLERDVDDVFLEAQALAAINHPAIIKVQDCGYVDSTKKQRPFLVMDHFDGATLAEYVKLKGPLSTEEFLALTEPVVAGLQAAHAKNILHRDIKPANLLVKRLKDTGGKPRWDVKLIDFGLAVKQAERRSASHPSKSGTGAGTIEYAAPEQLGKLEGSTVGPRADIYSFAKTACFALFGTTSPLLKHWKSIPQPLAELLERCLNERPEDRPVDLTVVSRCFARLGQGATASAIADVDIPVVNTIEPSRVANATAIRDEQPAHYTEDEELGIEEPQYVPPPPNGRGKKVLLVMLMLFATLGLMCCGGGGIGVYVGYDWLKGQINGGTEDDSTAFAAGNDPFKPGNGDPFRPGGNGFKPPSFDTNKKSTGTLTVSNVSSQLVADFVTAKINNEIEHKDGVRAKATAKRAPRYAGEKVTVTLEAEEGKLTEFARNLDLGAVEGNGNNLSIELLAPSAQSRKAGERTEGVEISSAELGRLVAKLNTDRFVSGECQQLASARPIAQYRNAVRQLLRKHAKDTPEALEALGVWGTAEDAEFIISMGEELRHRHGGHVVKALASLRAPAGISYLTRKLGDFIEGEQAFSALRNFGPVIEKDVISALQNKEIEGRYRACVLLKDFGSKAAIPGLKVATQDREEKVAKAAADAWKTIAFHPAEPVTSEPTTPVASKPKLPKTVDGAQVTSLDSNASSYLPNIAVAADGKGFYLLTPDEVRRYDWDGTVSASNKTAAMTLLAVGTEGVLVANSLDAKLLELADLNSKKSGPLNEPRWITAAQNVAVVRCEGAARLMLIVDIAAFTARNTYSDTKIPGAAGNKIPVLPAGIGRWNPVLTPDAKVVFTRGNGRLYRWKIDDYKLDRTPETGPLIAGTDSGQIVVSPDSKYVAWNHPDGNLSDPSFTIRPAAGSATFIFDVNDLKKPVAALVHGPKTTSMAFDNQGQVFFANSASRLIQYGPIQAGQENKPLKEFNLEEYGKIRQIVVNAEGDKVIVLTDKELLRLDLTK